MGTIQCKLFSVITKCLITRLQNCTFLETRKATRIRPMLVVQCCQRRVIRSSLKFDAFRSLSSWLQALNIFAFALLLLQKTCYLCNQNFFIHALKNYGVLEHVELDPSIEFRWSPYFSFKFCQAFIECRHISADDGIVLTEILVLFPN